MSENPTLKTIKVKIEKRHCEGANYKSNRDCGLARALKEMGFKDFVTGCDSMYFSPSQSHLIHPPFTREKFDTVIETGAPFEVTLIPTT